jgi:hypothetical protein
MDERNLALCSAENFSISGVEFSCSWFISRPASHLEGLKGRFCFTEFLCYFFISFLRCVKV